MNTEVADALWAQLEPTVYITRDQFMRGLAEWEIQTVEIDGRPAFITLTKGPEFHFTSLDTKSSVTLGLIRSLLAPILERHGCVTTRTPKEGADRQHRFNRAFGFREVGEDEFFVHYRKDRPCQS